MDSSIAKSPLWPYIKVLRLQQNMRAINDEEFSNFLLRIGDGVESTIAEDMICLPTSNIIPWEDENSVDKLIDHVYPDLARHAMDRTYMAGRGIITPCNEQVERLNRRVLQKIQGQERIYHSFDKVENDIHGLYQQEFLNSIAPGGLPPHELRLRVGSTIILLRNLDPKNGLCNGTRLICHALQLNFIDAEILGGPFKGNRVFLHRIPLKTPENMKLPFEMTRTQFSIRLSFALTINKAQGKIIPQIRIYLPDNVFSHGQLYVALSRGTSKISTKLLVKNGSIRGPEGVFTKNVVYKDILFSSS